MENKITPNTAVIWAIDPFEKETAPDSFLVQCLLNWVRSSNLKLQPVHVLSLLPGESDEEGRPEVVSTIKSATQKAVEQYLKDLGVTETLPAEILVLETLSRKEEVEALLECAVKMKSPCILVSSHGRSGLKRLAIGSFAENLLLRSKLPIFFLPHLENQDRSNTSFKRALFSTDFSHFSREAFLRFLPLAHRYQLEIHLFHSVSLPLGIAASEYGAPSGIPEDYFPKQVTWASEEAERWVKIAKSLEVPAHYRIDNEGLSSHTGESIIHAAEETNADLIAMASKSGAVTSLVMGSVARDVFRRHRYPVWVYGPKALEMNAHPHPTHRSAFA